ncbi:hypothetical protein, partial [Sphingobium indicum]|uniref:hypothetical protein n=2 Tax=Sphingobium indicum TaxID=332055 RepID=UPI001ABFBFE8
FHAVDPHTSLTRQKGFKVDDFYAARSRTIPPLPWSNIAPPFSGSPWTLERNSDKMTDEAIVSAVRKFETRNHVFDVTIACRNGSEITYDFTAFDTEQRAATLRRWDRELSDPAIRFQVRVDQQEAAEGYVTNPRYTNELMIGSDTPGITSSDMAKATKLVVRLLPNGGEETLEIDQTDSNVRSVMEACGIGAEPAENADAAGPNDAVLSATAYDLTDKQLISAFTAATGRSPMFTVETDHGSPAYVTPRQLLHMPFGAVLLANLTVKETGHAAAGGIRIYYLKHDGDRFLSSGKFEEIYTSDMGLPPEKITVTGSFTTYPAIYIEDGDGNGGYWSGWVDLIELRPEGPARSDAIPVYYSNKDAIPGNGEKPVELEGKIINIRRDKGFDVVDEKAGIRESYIRSGTKFVRAGGGASKFPDL